MKRPPARKGRVGFPNMVLSVLNQAYQDSDTWFTWSRYINSNNGSMGCSAPIGPEVYRNNSFRDLNWRFSHLHAYRVKLAKHLKREDLLEDDGKTFFRSGWDFYYLILLEKSNIHAKFIDQVLYVYNVKNNLSDCKINESEQVRLFEMGRRRPKHSKLEKL